MAIDGGAAFPKAVFTADGNDGMSLRDWFAGQAICGLVGGRYNYNDADWDFCAIAAYKFADAMLRAKAGAP